MSKARTETSWQDVPEPMKERIRSMLLATWGTIAGDWMQCCRDMGEPLTNRSAAEGVCDADRFVQYGHDPEAAAVFDSLGWKAMMRVATGLRLGE